METSKPVNILLVDDREDNLLALNAVLRSSEYCLVNATSGKQALECLAERDFAVILLDVQMPEMDGLETARRLRSMERSVNTPIILVTGMFPDEKHIRLGYEVGAVDFVSKPFDPRIMKCKVAVFAELFRKTEKIRAQEKLLHEAAEMRFRTLFEQSLLGIELYSRDGECVEVNQAWEKLWGPHAADLRRVNPVKDPERIPTGKAIQRALAGESSDLSPTRLHGKWIKSVVYPVRNERGEIREAAVILKDVSEQTVIEEELRRSRDQLKIIFESVADGIIVHDLKENCLFANDVCARMLGFPNAEELMAAGGPLACVRERFDVCDKDGTPLTVMDFPTTIVLRGEQNQAERVERLRHRVTGRETWMVASARPVLDDAGQPHLVVTVLRDITEQRRKEANERFLADATAILAASLDSNDTLKRIIDLAVGTMADWCKIRLADESGALKTVAVKHINPDLLHLANETDPAFAIAPELWSGSDGVFKSGEPYFCSDIPDSVLVDVASSAEHLRRLRLLSPGSIMIVPIRVRDRVLGTIGLAYAQNGRHYDHVDLTLAEELGRRVGMAIENAMLYTEAQSQRERLQKAVQARDEFISIASHELKTPVTSLILHAELAALQLQRGESDEELRDRLHKYVSISTSQIDRLSRLIEEMLDVSRIANGKLSMEMETLDLGQLVRSVVEDFSEQIQEAGAFADLEANGPALVSCDRYRIEQVVTNLLTNAIKYGEGRPVSISMRTEDGKVHLSIRDEGIGIAEEHQHRIFERFERAVSASAVSGLGLGLYIVKRIVQAHGGDVTVESSVGKGSTFTVSLPQA